MSRLATILLWLFVIDLGVAFGAGLYEARVVIPAWSGTSPETWPNTGLLFWVYVTTIPLTLLTLASAIVAWRCDAVPSRTWWLAAVAVVVLERVTTFAYFIPAMIRLSSATDTPQSEINAGLSQWLLLNDGRHALTLAAFLTALKALSLLEKRP
jgi:hypothetical protein